MIDPAIAGTTLQSVRFPLDRSKLAELARAFGDDDPAWQDPQAAEAAGFDTLPVPPTATVLVDHWREGGALSTAVAIGADLDRLLHGEASWELLRPVRAGEELTARASVTDVTTRHGKRGGAMTVVTMVS
jgi:acyl dehydratase